MKSILFSCLYYLSLLLSHTLSYTIIKDTVTTKENYNHQYHHETTKSSNSIENQHQRHITPKYHYTIDELLNTTFPTRISDDIDLDPCKTGKIITLVTVCVCISHTF